MNTPSARMIEKISRQDVLLTGTRILRNGECGSGNIDITLLSGGIYEAMITTVGGLIAGITSHVCLQLPGDAGRPCGKQNGISYDGIHGPVERACKKKYH